MATGAYNENAYENAVLEVLRSMKWEYMYGPDIERDYSDPTLPDVFEYQVRSISGGSLVVRNAIFTDWLQNGVDGACRVAGDDTTRLVQLVDYAHPEKNAFHAVNQWTVQNGEVVKRPDVVLFVNGMPLVVIELKNPSKPETTVHEAFLQLRNYQHDIPDLFTYNQICVASDMVSTRAGSLTAGESWFKEWKSIDGKKEDGAVGNFETLFRGLLAQHLGPRRLAVVALDVGAVFDLPSLLGKQLKHRLLVGILVVRSRRHHATFTFSTSISPLISFGSSASRVAARREFWSKL